MTDPYVILFDALDRRFTLDEVVSAFSGFSLHILGRDTPAGVVMIRGAEIHVALLPAHRKKHIWRRELSRYLGGVVQQYGYAVTALPHDKDDRFLKRLGFQEYTFDMFNTYYQLKESRYVRT